MNQPFAQMSSDKVKSFGNQFLSGHINKQFRIMYTQSLALAPFESGENTYEPSSDEYLSQADFITHADLHEANIFGIF